MRPPDPHATRPSPEGSNATAVATPAVTDGWRTLQVHAAARARRSSSLPRTDLSGGGRDNPSCTSEVEARFIAERAAALIGPGVGNAAIAGRGPAAHSPPVP